jgi:hypothetical protein
MSSPDAVPAAPALRVVRGEPTPEELAVLLALAAAAGDGADAGAAAPVRGGWSDPAWRMRGTWLHGPGGWRAAGR